MCTYLKYCMYIYIYLCICDIYIYIYIYRYIYIYQCFGRIFNGFSFSFNANLLLCFLFGIVKKWESASVMLFYERCSKISPSVYLVGYPQMWWIKCTFRCYFLGGTTTWKILHILYSIVKYTLTFGVMMKRHHITRTSRAIQERSTVQSSRNFQQTTKQNIGT